MHAFIITLYLAASALAYKVISPNGSQGWTTTGPNSITWQRDSSTDPQNFSVALTNPDRSIMQFDNQILLALVDGTNATSAPVNPPSGGWPHGAGFKVNLLKDSEDVTSILASSDTFEIKAPNTTSTSSSLNPTSYSLAPPAQSPTTDASGAAATNDAGLLRADPRVIGLLALLGAILA